MNGHYCRCCGATDTAIEVEFLACPSCVALLLLDKGSQRREMVRLYRKGYGVMDIGHLVGLSHMTVHRTLVREGIQTRSVGVPAPLSLQRDSA